MLSVKASVLVDVDLSGHLNHRAATRTDDLKSGTFNVWRNSVPAQCSNFRCHECGMWFDVSLTGTSNDNVVPDSQRIALPPGNYSTLHMVVASERAAADVFWLTRENVAIATVQPVFPDLWEGDEREGGHLAFRSSTVHYPHHVQERIGLTLWHVEVPVIRAGIDGIQLPRNPALHLFAAALEESND